jgi:hypothetical protein
VRPALSKRKVLTYSSVPYSTVELLHPCPQQTAKGPPCAETSLQVVKPTRKQTPFDLYRPATGLGRVADNTNKLQKCYMYMLQNCYRFVAKRRVSVLFLFFQFSVDPACGFQIQQDRQCAYDATLRRIRITIVAVEKQ